MKRILALALALGLIPSVAHVVSAAKTPKPTFSLGKKLTLKDEGMFFVNGQLVLSAFPSASGSPPTPGTFDVNQMYVHYRIPAKSKKHKLPIIMVHGAGLTGMSYETTPDGREGWATYFTRQGFSTYIVDFPGRGRSGFNVTPLNQAKNQNNVALQPSLARTGVEGAFVTFRFGDVYPTPYPDTQFPTDALEQFSAQGVPNAEATLTPASGTTVPAAIAALLQKIGPAILMVHSQAGQFADAAVELHPELVQMMIHVESNCPALTSNRVAQYVTVPHVLYVHGDHVLGNPSSTAQSRLDLCHASMIAINGAGGHATQVQLPDVGIHGNSHMMMEDKNNLEVADFIISEIKKNKL